MILGLLNCVTFVFKVAGKALACHLEANRGLTNVVAVRELLRQFGVFETVTGELVSASNGGLPVAPSAEWANLLSSFEGAVPKVLPLINI